MCVDFALHPSRQPHSEQFTPAMPTPQPEARMKLLTFSGMRQLVRAEWISWDRHNGDISCPLHSLKEFSIKASLSSLLESSSHSSSEGSEERANQMYLGYQRNSHGGCSWSGGGRWGGQTARVSWEQTFTTAHVDNNFQSSLLSCQQRHGLSQLLVSRLETKQNKTSSIFCISFLD